MNFLAKLFSSKHNQPLSILEKDKIAEMLKISPETLDKFEAAYHKHGINFSDGNLFDTSSKQASAELHANTDMIAASTDDMHTVKNLTNRIVNELLYQTETLNFNGTTLTKNKFHTVIEQPVTIQDIKALPKKLRPQLTGTLMTKDIHEDASEVLMYYYNEITKIGWDKTHPNFKMLYGQFRRGLDMMDLDWLTYRMIDTNPNSIGHWFPELVDANADKNFFKIPKTKICKVPITLLQLSRISYETLTPTTLDIVDKWAMQTFGLDENQEYFIKTGMYSSKFDFRNAHVYSPKEVRELGEYLVFIQNQAVIMAGPLTQPSTYGMGTTVEWVVREFIPDKENNPEIYKGMPLHTEYRVFIDCDTKSVLNIHPYWDPDVMKQRFGHENDADSPHQIHDYIIYQMHEETLMKRYTENKDRIIDAVQELLPDLNLTGQWSLDIMQNDTDFWLIDMATAETSAFYDYVPKHLRNPRKENWLPDLSREP